MGMNREIAWQLCRTTDRFYEAQAASFSATRRSGWAGWNRCLEEIARDSASRGEAWPPERLSVLDLACGNMRFERYLSERLPGSTVEATAVDGCEKLAESSLDFEGTARFVRLDIAACLHEGRDLAEEIGAPACALCACFGFMHHLPLPRWREEVLRTLADRTRPGGFACISFWQFLNSEELAEKARTVDAAARAELGIPRLEEGDFLLGWKNLPGQYRYCHHFSRGEVDALADAVSDKADVVARFEADGRTGDLNGYLVLRAR